MSIRLNGKVIAGLYSSGGGSGVPVGTIFAHTCTTSFVPENSLPCDGAEYAQSQFQTFYNDWLVGGRLNTCTYEEYQTDIDTYGECLKWAINLENEKFKVPYKKSEILPQNAKIAVIGNGKALGVTDGTTEKSLGKFPTVAIDTGNYNSNNLPTTLSQNSYNNNSAIGLSTDKDKSGIVGDLSQTEKLEIRYFVVVATGAIKQTEMDWSKYFSALEGKLNADHSNDTKPYITETYINSQSGYIIYSNGLCEQWGALINASTSGFVSLLKSFKDTNYCLVSSWGTTESSTDTGGYGAALGLSNKTISSFRYLSPSGYNFSWLAIGYI